LYGFVYEDELLWMKSIWLH